MHGVWILVLIKIVYSWLSTIWGLGCSWLQEGVGSGMLVSATVAAKYGVLGFGGVSRWSQNPYPMLIGIDSFVRLGYKRKSE